MADFYPFIGGAEDYEGLITNQELPLLRELAWDFSKNGYIIDEATNDFKIVEGLEALKVWIYFALKTDRFEHLIYSWDYGTELTNLVGQRFSKGLTESEAYRYIEEALIINPYILSVKKNSVIFDGDNLQININVNSIYGEVDFSVRR